MARLFFEINREAVASFEAGIVPRVGDAVWIKTADFQDTLIVESIEYQFDRSKPDTYANDDICRAYCTSRTTRNLVPVKGLIHV